MAFAHPRAVCSEGIFIWDAEGRTKRVILQGEIPNPIKIPSGCRFHPRCPQAVPECQEVDPQLRTVTLGYQVACIHV